MTIWEKSKNNTEGLPSWFARPHPVRTWQASLFQIGLKDALARLNISEDDLSRWHAKGWISFDSSAQFKISEYDDPRVFELTIVRDVVRSGLSDAHIESLLDILPKPFAFDPDRIAFSFQYGWVEAIRPEMTGDVIEKNLDSWLEDLAERGEIDRLQDIHDRITEFLEHASKENLEDKTK